MNPKLDELKAVLLAMTPDDHKHKIAADTLKMPDAMAGVMGGPSKAEARKTLGQASPAEEHGGLLHKMAHAVGGRLYDMHKAYKEGAAAAAEDWKKPEYRTGDSEPVKVRGAPAGHPHPHMWNAGYGLTMGAYHDQG